MQEKFNNAGRVVANYLIHFVAFIPALFFWFVGNFAFTSLYAYIVLYADHWWAATCPVESQLCFLFLCE